MSRYRPYVLPFLLFFLLKWWRMTATATDLAFILWPTAQAVELLTGQAGYWIPGEGYHFPNAGFLIDAGCAGFTFFLLSFSVLVVALLPNWRTWVATLLALLLALPVTVVANVSRIITVEWGYRHFPSLLSGPTAHELQGGLVYFFFLTGLYLLTIRLTRQITLS